MTHKKMLRAELAARLRALAPATRESHGALIQARLLTLAPYVVARTVAVYLPLATEVPLASFMVAAQAAGKRLCYPRTQPPERVLAFHAPTQDDGFRPGPLGLREPAPDTPVVPLAEIDLFIVPGLAFTSQGHRLGRGAGHYDATLAAAAPSAVRAAPAFSAQIVDTLPTTGHDMIMDWVITETDIFRGFRGLARPQ